jgi:hypothetical protein
MENPPANPDRDEVVLPDTGGWISGPCVDAEPVAAQDVEVGDTLLLEDGIRAELTDVRFGYYQFPKAAARVSQSAGAVAARRACCSAGQATC